LIKCLTGVNKFEAGEIYLDGIEGPIVNKDTMDAQKKGISTVYQEVNLCPNLSVAENLYIGREPLTRIGTVDRKKMNAMAAKLMKELNLDVDVTVNLEEYSLALQQMIAIARAVDMECKVLILDEPTSSLDDHEVEKLFGMMRRLKEQGVGIIFVTHFLEQVYAVCDGITVLRNGTLVGEYDIEELPRLKLVAAMMGKNFDAKLLKAAVNNNADVLGTLEVYDAIVNSNLMLDGNNKVLKWLSANGKETFLYAFNQAVNGAGEKAKDAEEQEF
jgi:simple sugar transport system ATP-binding protein